MEIPRGRGVSKKQFLKGKYGTKLEFREGVRGSSYSKKPSVGGVWIFSGTTQYPILLYILTQTRFPICVVGQNSLTPEGNNNLNIILT